MLSTIVKTIKEDTTNNLVKEIIRQMDDIGRKYYSRPPSGYVSYGEPVEQENQTGNITLTNEELSDIRIRVGIHTHKDFIWENLPSCMGHSGVLDVSKFPETVCMYDANDLSEISKKHIYEAYIAAEGAREIYEVFGDTYAVIDIASGENFKYKEGFAEVYLKVRDPLSAIPDPEEEYDGEEDEEDDEEE